MLAAVVGVNRTLKFPHDVIRINTLLTMNTLDWISRNPIKRLLFSSSSENYAGTSDLFNTEIPTAEDVPLCIGDVKHPRWTYAMTKMHGECAFIHSADIYNYECTVVRYQNIIGPEMGFGHAIPHIVERFVKGEKSPFKIYGHDQTRAFCYIDDAVMGTVGAMESDKAAGEIYHIGKQDEINMETLTTYIGGLMDYSGAYKAAMTYPGSVANMINLTCRLITLHSTHCAHNGVIYITKCSCLIVTIDFKWRFFTLNKALNNMRDCMTKTHFRANDILIPNNGAFVIIYIS
jgi:nucleoside-diphosphate-sugar epimerase